MKDKSSNANRDDPWRNKYHASEAELREKEKHWQDTEKLLRLLISRLTMLVDCPDQTLTNNLQVLRKALCEGENILQLNSLIKDISDRILALESTELKTIQHRAQALSANDGNNDEQLNLIFDVFMVLLENINFPTLFADQIEKIKFNLQKQNPADTKLRLLAGITALAEVLDDIFYSVKYDKQKFGLFLQQLNSELQGLDKGLTVSNGLQTQKQKAVDTINSKVVTEVLEMENTITTQHNIEEFKRSVQNSVNTIRDHMENFKQQEQQRNQQAKQVADKLRKQLRGMENQCAELKKQVLEKHQQILSDPLTGIRNRLAYEEAINNEIDRFRRYNRPACLLMLDLDNFKHVNDTHGHSVGDKALQFVARILAKNVRSVDFLARYGGEEFVVILPELELIDAKQAAQKICQAVQANKLNIDGNTIQLSISGGIAQIRQDDTAESLFERADTALYLAKERGRNRCETE